MCCSPTCGRPNGSACESTFRSCASINLPSLVLTLGALIAVFRFKIGMIKVLLACSALGIVYYLATGATS